MCYELKKIKPFKQDSFLLKIDVGSHAAGNAKSGCYRRSDWNYQLDYQLPSFLFQWCTHNDNFFSGEGWEVRGERIVSR